MKIVPKRIDLIATLPNGSVIAEIGVRRGEFTFEMMELGNLAHVYAIDAWRLQTWSAEQQDDCEHADAKTTFYRNLRGHLQPGGRLSVIDSLSLDAAKMEHIVPLDAFFLDAAHDFQNVLNDLLVWEKRLKRKGCILGHDYTDNDIAKSMEFGVVDAVNHFCREFGWYMSAITEEEFPSYRLDRI